MPYKIFLSHNHSDKPLVEAVALRLATIFGQEAVFYDSWSIRPGDGIIDRMNSGLEAPDFIFFFVSEKSLASEMVKLEWQNGLYAATKGHTRIIPIRVDGSTMPPVLMQTLYIDMHTVGLEAAISQIVSVAQGYASYTPQHLGFSNLTYSTTTDAAGVVDVVIRASHLMEPNPNFMLLVGNSEKDVAWSAPGAPATTGGFNPDVILNDGSKHNGIAIRPLNVSLTPKLPVRLRLTPKDGAVVDLHHVLHQTAENSWDAIPLMAPA